MAQELLNGPDQIYPSEELTTTDAGGHVRLRIPKSGQAIETDPPVSVPGMFQKTVKTHPKHTAYAYKADKTWVKVTYEEYYQLVRTCAKAFLHLGLERHRSVCILGFNSPEWFISDLGAIFAGGIAVGIYTTNSSEACYHCIETSGANIVVVEDEKQLEKVMAIKERLPNLKSIIQYQGQPTTPGVLSWNDVLELGRRQSDERLEKVLKSISINECCTLVFTSGTVGKPKAVMLSHDNLIWDALAIGERVGLELGAEVLVSYLPLSHVAAQVIDIHTVTRNAACVYFADKNALKGSLINTLQEVQPTKFLAVPRVWEKMFERMQQVAAQSGPIRRAIANWAKSQALNHHLSKLKGNNHSSGWGYYIASTLIFSKIKKTMGLDRCTLFASAAAPLAPDVKRYFLSLDMPIMEAFGMSEASGAHTLCVPSSFGLETIGRALPGMKTKIDKPENGSGEICLYGRHVFMGYLNEKTKTDETIDSEGWLHTGDLGSIDEKGFAYITGRSKELIITAGGENVAPVPIEQIVKAELPHISNAFLVGDRRKFISILLTLKTEVDSETGMPLDKLIRPVQDWLNTLGCPATTVTEVLAAGPHPKLLAAIKEGLDRVNKQAISNAQKIQKAEILPCDFSVATNELGPTMKVKRNVVAAKYSDLINKIYE